MIVRIVSQVLESPLWPVVVVVGSSAAAVKSELARLPVLIADNPAWIEGMASSLRTGVTVLQSFSRRLNGALIALCDQPAFSTDTVTRLIHHAPVPLDDHIVASRYSGRIGAPALFSRTYFQALGGLSGDEGARHVIAAARQAGRVIEVEMPELALDLDTPDDVARMRKR